MDKLVKKLVWLLAGVYLLISLTSTQEVRRLPVSSRRKLPTVIITREHLRQRQNSYGVHGDTAAEFVVSAGLDTSQNSAVRIRRIGHNEVNNTDSIPAVNRRHFQNTGNPRPIPIRLDQRQRIPTIFDANERNGISNTPVSFSNRRHNVNGGAYRPQPINRRYHVENIDHRRRLPSNHHFGNRNIHPISNVERRNYQYRPPIYVPYYQQNRRADVALGVPGENFARTPNRIINETQKRSSLNEHQYPIVSVKYSTSSVTSSTSPKRLQRPFLELSPRDKQHKRPVISPNNRNPNISIDKHQQIRQNVRTQDKHSVTQESVQTSTKPINIVNNTDHLYIALNNPLIYPSKDHAAKSNFNPYSQMRKTSVSQNNGTIIENPDQFNILNKIKNTHGSNKSRSNINEGNKNTTSDSVVETGSSPINIVTETLSLQLNSTKNRGFQTHLIRKPSIILQDQIRVNELPKTRDRPRFGPRLLESSDVSYSKSRQKRQVENYFNDIAVGKDGRTIENISNESFIDKINDRLFSSNLTKTNLTSNASQRKGRYDFQAFESNDVQIGDFKDNLYASEQLNENSSIPTNFIASTRVNESSTFNNISRHQFSDIEYYYDGEENLDKDILSFADFIVSPISEKLRLERQLLFRESNFTNNNESFDSPLKFGAKHDSKFSKRNTLEYLRKLLALRLIHTLLNMSNVSTNYSNILKSGRAIDSLTPAEQRRYGIMVSPYEGQESQDFRKSNAPVIKILKGRIVSLPDLPPELIPIILGTYKPSSTSEYEEPHDDDDKISDNVLDNAIYTLLQNEELLNIQPVIPKEPPMIHKSNRKSPSTKYIGSLKSSEPLGRPNFSFKPQTEWSLGPRCDRLTEEICLDDSDYPSSAIMSSIYKDKSRFDLMYAEVKVRESQVEGLSRQQETAYSYDHYYGSYPQSTRTSLVAKDYGPNGGFVCPSEVHYARPHRAKNRKGRWKVVVNVGEYTQTLRMEKCLASGSPCKYVVSHIDSSCSQVYSYHRLLVFNKENGLHIDVFRIPTSCTCHLRPGNVLYKQKLSASSPFLMRPNLYDDFGGHVETAHSPPVLAESPNLIFDKKKNSFGNTLWAILGGGQQATTLAQQPQFLDEVQKQIAWTQQLKKYPHLLKHISPNQVLKQLLEEDDDYAIRRHRIRQKSHLDHLMSGGFASHQIPIAVPLPPPPPPPSGVHRRPVVNIPPRDQKHFYASNLDGHSKVVGVPHSEPTKIFSLTKGAKIGKAPERPNFDPTRRNVYNRIRPHHFTRLNGFKILPGMYPPKSENVQVPESSLLPIAPQFTTHSNSRVKPVIKPIPVPQGSNKYAVHDEDLIALEKSEGNTQSYTSEDDADDKGTFVDGSDSKVNFSYHPILEYLNM